jgi:hypothetical protein
MNKEKQRIAIAEACGWKDIKDTNHEDVNIESRSISCWSGLTGVPPKFIHYEWNRVIIPDYLNNLNAMHEAEMSRVDMEDGRFIVLFREYLHTILGHDGSLAIHATAAQRAEAFLRTIGKWEDDE